jgi:hypothetical protein
MADLLNNGCTTVNCGIIKVLNERDPFIPEYPMMVEVLRPENHNPYANIVCYYYWDKENCRKVEVTISVNFKVKSKPRVVSEVYFFHSKTDSQHYTSRVYNLDEVPAKYSKIIALLKIAYNIEFSSTSKPLK